MNTTVISGRLVRNPGYNEVENERGLHKIAKFVLAVRRNYSDEVSFIPVKARLSRVIMKIKIPGKRSIPPKCMQTGLNLQVQKWLTDHHFQKMRKGF